MHTDAGTTQGEIIHATLVSGAGDLTGFLGRALGVEAAFTGIVTAALRRPDQLPGII